MAQAITAQQAAGMDINAIYGKFKDRGAWPYYDVIYLDMGTGGTSGAVSSTYTPFSVPVGSLDPVFGANKTRVQTNMISAGNQYGFGSTRCLILMGIGFQFASWLNKASVDLILNNCFMQFQIAEKVFYEGTLDLWPGGFGLFGVSTVGGEETWTNGIANPHAMRRFGIEYGKYIAPTVPFTLTISFPQNTPTLTSSLGTATPGALTNGNNSHICSPIMKILLDGTTDREIQ
jgi:hypothetical protein